MPSWNPIFHRFLKDFEFKNQAQNFKNWLILLINRFFLLSGSFNIQSLTEETYLRFHFISAAKNHKNRFLERSWEVLAASKAVLERSWKLLGPSWATLERS